MRERELKKNIHSTGRVRHMYMGAVPVYTNSFLLHSWNSEQYCCALKHSCTHIESAKRFDLIIELLSIRFLKHNHTHVESGPRRPSSVNSIVPVCLLLFLWAGLGRAFVLTG